MNEQSRSFLDRFEAIFGPTMQHLNDLERAVIELNRELKDFKSEFVKWTEAELQNQVQEEILGPDGDPCEHDSHT